VHSLRPPLQLESYFQWVFFFFSLPGICINILEQNPPIQQVIETGILSRLVEFLKRNDAPNIQVFILSSDFIFFFKLSSNINSLKLLGH
jgi:hypothetical protein